MISNSLLPENLTAEIEKNLNAAPRKEAVESFFKSGLPTKKHEEYRYFQIADLLEKILQSAFKINFKPKEHFPAPVPFQLPGSISLTFVNGKLSSESGLPEGISLSESSATSQRDPFANLNEIFCEKSLNLEISGATEKFIHIHHHSYSEAGASLSFPKINIRVKAGVECSIVETFGYEGENHHFSAPLLNALVEENAVFHYVRLQQCAGNWSQVYNSMIRQKENSTVHAFVLTTDGLMVRNNFSLEVDGSGAEGNVMGLYLLNGKTIADNHTIVDHTVPNACSNELFKGVMHGNSKGVFNGKIFVRQDAQKTNAFQSNRNIILSDSATMNTKPQLEIWADDVKCSHGCTTGQLDEEAVFYLQSRGIDKATAQSMLLDAFAGEVTEKIKSETIRKAVSDVVSKKIAALK